MLYVCLSAQGTENALKQLGNSKYAELRIDLVKPTCNDLEKMLSNKDVSYIATCRPGAFDEPTSIAMLETAIKSGADYVDVEIERGQEIAARIKLACKNTTCKMIISYHNFEETPDFDELQAIVEKCVNYGADCVKIACKVNFPQDNAKLLSLYNLDENIVAFGMGEKGKISRLASLYCGAPFTYVSANFGNATAPGQISEKEISNLMKYF